MTPPTITVDVRQFWQDPYPDLEKMRRHSPVCFVPELNAVLVTRHSDIFRYEKMTDLFSSEQPGGLMTELMGENMMRRDGEAHREQRRQMNPSVSPRAVKETWRAWFEQDTNQVLEGLAKQPSFDLVRDYAMPVSANALRRVTGLLSMTPAELDGASQGMIDGISNYTGDPAVQQKCHDATALIDRHIDALLPSVTRSPEPADMSLLSTLLRAGQSEQRVRANIKLAISGGQNEPRDAIAGTAWALLTHPEQLEQVRVGAYSYLNAFEEYARWISPIGMAPRRIARDDTVDGIELQKDTRAFLMFGSGNRDESVFEAADQFQTSRNTSKTIAFGAGPHFCAGAWISRCLIGEVALPKLFERFPNLQLKGSAPFGGWAFRGLLKLPVSTGTR